MAGGPDLIPVQTNPPGATVFVNGQPVGQTPLTVALSREQDRGNIQIVAPGFQPFVIERTKSVNGWFWANLCWGVLPIVIDLVTGDVKRFDDTPISTGLTPGGNAGYPPPGYTQQQPQPGYPQAPPAGPGTMPTQSKPY